MFAYQDRFRSAKCRALSGIESRSTRKTFSSRLVCLYSGKRRYSRHERVFRGPWVARQLGCGSSSEVSPWEINRCNRGRRWEQRLVIYRYGKHGSSKLYSTAKSTVSRFSLEIVYPGCRHGGDDRCASRWNTVCRWLQHDRDATTMQLQPESPRHVDIDQDGNTSYVSIRRGRGPPPRK